MANVKTRRFRNGVNFRLINTNGEIGQSVLYKINIIILINININQYLNDTLSERRNEERVNRQLDQMNEQLDQAVEGNF